jgi:hypothetical protein
MKLSAAIILFISSLVIVGLVGWIGKADHRTDRDVPGATTGAGKASVADPQGTFQEQGVTR